MYNTKFSFYFTCRPPRPTPIFSFLSTDIWVLKAHQCLFTKHHGCIFCILLIFFFPFVLPNLCCVRHGWCRLWQRIALLQLPQGLFFFFNWQKWKTRAFVRAVINVSDHRGCLSARLFLFVCLFLFPILLLLQNCVVLDGTCLRWCVF